MSIWRYSHYLLAISSSVFLLIASLTGAILAFEPISVGSHHFAIEGADDLPIAEVIRTVKSNHNEVLTIRRDVNGFVSIVALQDGSTAEFYIDPFTGEKIGDLIEKTPVFQFATNLHRSLFLKTPGRLFVGLTALLLLLIVVSGVALLLKRQGGGLKAFFAPVVKEGTSSYLHIVGSRVALVPILVVAVTGVYLSLLRFEVITEPVLVHNIDFDSLKDSPAIPYTRFEVFTGHALSELRQLDFPFSDFVEDYYHVALRQGELQINQFTGEVLSEQSYPIVKVLSALALVWHTGAGSVWWSVVLGLGSVAIVVLMYTGFAMRWKRPKVKVKNTRKPAESRVVILVGSESGSTWSFAQALQQAIDRVSPCYVTALNDYEPFENMECLLVLTATYGQGEAPANASRFEALISDRPPVQPFTYSVLGFGSLAYPDFCAYAYRLDSLLSTVGGATRMQPVYTVNDRSFEAFSLWVNQLGKARKWDLRVEKVEPLLVKKKKASQFTVVKKEESKSDDTTFLLEIGNLNGYKPRSGDLLAVYPNAGGAERLYSIGNVPGSRTVLMSVKRHEKGVCSNYLYHLQPDETLSGYIIANKGFRCSTKAPSVVMIATGTGIGPFLGMIAENNPTREMHLFWGGRNKETFGLYKSRIEEAIDQQKLTNFQPAYSREQAHKIYVQHLVEKEKNLIARVLMERGEVMICGSVAMQKEVVAVLSAICSTQLQKTLSYYQNKGQIKMDCY